MRHFVNELGRTKGILAMGLVAAGLATVTCGGTARVETGTGGTAGTGGTGGTTTSSTTTTSEQCESFAPCCDDVTGQALDPICPTPGVPECPAGSDWPTGDSCPAGLGASCDPQTACAPATYCDYPDDRCGAGEPGTCTLRPSECDLNYAPTCLCNGSVGSNACAGAQLGQDVAIEGGCPAPDGTFGCGSIFCALGTSYCRRTVSDVPPIPDGYECLPIPAGCPDPPVCACLQSEPCGQWCEAAGAAQLTLTCPGG
jgi:hypothetical protein